LTVLVLALAAVAALAMAIALRRDAVYALTSNSAASLGDLRTASASTLEANENRFVRADGMLGVAGGIRYERPFSEDTFRTLPVPGRAEGGVEVWVEVRVPPGQESGRWEPPRSFAGRLVRLDAAGPRHRGIATAIEQTTGQRVPKDAWLLVDAEDPKSARWAILLAAIFLGFVVWNAAAITRIVRKVS
jgi:hypothetical protein